MVMRVIMVVFAVMIVVVIVILLLEDGFEVFGEGLLGGAIDLADRNAAFGGDLRARLEFGCE